MEKSESTICLTCQGTGKCSKCSGKGSTVRSTPAPIASISGIVHGKADVTRTCTKCYGSGLCQSCKGTGKKSASSGKE